MHKAFRVVAPPVLMLAAGLLGAAQPINGANEVFALDVESGAIR